MTLEPIGFPGPQQHGLSHAKQQELLRKVRKPLTVDKRTMWMRETSGGTVIGVRPTGRGGTTLHRWYRIIKDTELAACVPGEYANAMLCRDTLGCGGDDAPSLYGIWTDFDPVTCTQKDQDTTCTLIYFPSRYAACLNNIEPDACGGDRWTGVLVQAFWNAEHLRWESDSVKQQGDVLDFVEFCDDYPILSCGGGSCPDPLQPAEPCCLYDGRVRRDLGPIGDQPEDCTYQCGARNKAFDVWILCTDRTSLPAGQTCFVGRRVDDAYTTQYCAPAGTETIMITETRPVYSIGCCGCGCPLDELYLEFNFTKETIDGRVVIPNCEANGMSVTVKLNSFIDPLFPGEVQYDGYFCHSYEIPIFLAMVEDPADPYPIFLRPDCVTGAPMSGQFADVADLLGLGGGCCYSGTSGNNADPQFFNHQFDVFKQYVSGGTGPGDPMICDDQWQTCKFCYQVRLTCFQGNLTNLEIQQAIPPGMPHYTGTPQEDPNAPLENLILFGDTNVFSELSERCNGRNYYEMDLHFGNVDPYDLLTPAQQVGLIGWPHLYDHVFGGCCWDHVVLGTTRGVCHSAVQNICACCGFSDAALDACRDALGTTCNPKAFVKVGWNCRNDQTWS